MNILMVGEQNDEWKKLQNQLEELDHILIRVPSCTEGKKKLDNDYSIDTVIINIDSTDECGLRLLKAVHTHRKLSEIPILMAGTSFTDQNVVDYHSLKAFDIILLPSAQPTLEAKILKAEREGRKHVLIVDDEEIITDILANFLEIERYVPIIAHSGEEALEKLKRNVVHAIITDIMMPGIDGFELLVKVKDEYPNIPVIMITGHSGIYQPKQIIESGADGFFSKPFKNTEMMFTLKIVLQKYSNKHQYVNS